MFLSRYGLRECLLITLLALAAMAAFTWLAWTWAIAITVIIWFALLLFFRDPVRRMPRDLAPGAMLSPADGTISAVETIEHHEATDGPAIIIRIFLSIFNVHINRIPCDGEIVRTVHRPGEYRDARTPESAQVNESNLIIMRLPSEETIGVRQVSGAVARRIVCDLQPAQHVQHGDRFGMIKFGSTTELILPRPDDVTVQVQKGDAVKGALTIIAELRPAAHRESNVAQETARAT